MTEEESKLSKTKFCNAIWRSPHSSFASQNPPSPLEKAYLGVSLGDSGGGWLNRSSTGCRGRRPLRRMMEIQNKPLEWGFVKTIVLWWLDCGVFVLLKSPGTFSESFPVSARGVLFKELPRIKHSISNTN